MILKKLRDSFSICQVSEIPYKLLKEPYLFFAHTKEEISLVCPTRIAPAYTIKKEDDWVGLKIEGILDFSLIGVLADITQLLAQAKISVFAVSTYNTDYIFIKQEFYSKAERALIDNDYAILTEEG